MNNELICTPVMLPTKDETSSLLLVAGEPKLRVNKHGTYASGEGWDYQYLYLVIEEDIKEGDWIYDVRDSYLGKHSGKSMHPDYEKANYRKVIATTDKSLSLPLIPSSFIERWVNEHGKIDKVRILSHNGIPVTFNNSETEQHVVNILPIEDKTFSREEIKNILSEYVLYTWNEFMGEKYNQTDEHKAHPIIWFDKHY